MSTELTTGWWTCPGCGEDAELIDGGTAGCTEPCPRCDAPMVLCWEAVCRARRVDGRERSAA